MNVLSNPSKDSLDQLKVFTWPTWSCDVSEFPWAYDSTETCYILKGSAQITASNGETVVIKKGDLCTFREGLSCIWKVTEPILKHYNFEN
eukprot:gene4065-4445_t